MFGTVDSYLVYMLSKEKNHFTDVTNASRTLLFNIKSMEWDDELLDLFEIPKTMMPASWFSVFQINPIAHHPIPCFLY